MTFSKDNTKLMKKTSIYLAGSTLLGTCAFLGSTLLMPSPALADVKMSRLFGDNMILQRNVEAPIWGEATPGEKVTVKIAGQSKAVTAGADGRWMIKLAPLQAMESTTLQVIGNNTITINNVAVGEVWLCSGQSNMGFPINGASNAKAAIAEANDPQLRLFGVTWNTSPQPLKEIGLSENGKNGKWSPTTPETVMGFSAVAYFYGKELRKKLNVPVGLINSSWGGTPAEAWTSQSQFEADPQLLPLIAQWDQSAAEYPEALKRYQSKTLPSWKAQSAKAVAQGQTPPPRPKEPENDKPQHRPTNLYNAMISPLVPFAMKGAIWYQGENNASRAEGYHRLLSAMIAGWRRDFGAKSPQDFAFYIVQLANFHAVKTEPSESKWAELRDAQAQTAKQPGNGLALAIDIGSEKDIHPKNKQDVGRRLALVALAQTYGKKNEYSGPVYQSMKVEGNKIRLKFSHAKGLMSKSPTAIPGFAIAGADKVWKWANVRIDGQEIVVSNDSIPAPVAVRYAWADNPQATIYNDAGLPAVPFRTDNWALAPNLQ